MDESPIPLHELDAVAAYVQAGRELRQSAFFSEDFHRLSVTTVGGQLTNVEFPDPNVRDAMLMSFRRLWSEKEPSNYLKVSKILARHFSQWRNVLKEFRSQFQSGLAEYQFIGPITKPDGLSPNDVLDLWINGRIFHSGKTGRVGKFTRDDFEQHRNEIGAVQFEYLLLVATWYTGITFCNLLQYAEVALTQWESQGLHTSFQIDEINRRGEHTSDDGINVNRATPGWSITNESPGEKVARLRRRGAFRPFNSFAGLLNVSDDQLAVAISSSQTLDKMCCELGFSFEEAKSLDWNDVNGGVSFCDNEATRLRNGRSRKGTAARKDKVILMADDALPILIDQFAEFRQVFDEPSGSV